MPVESIECPKCQASLTYEDQFCPSCGVSAAAERERQRVFAAVHAPKLASARNWLLALAAWYVLGNLLGVATAGDRLAPLVKQIVVALGLGLCVVQLGLWWWSGRAFLAAAVVSLVLFVTVFTLDAVADPTAIWKGILLKVVFAAGLTRAVSAGVAARQAS
ncbi:MAG: zinc ribbon domain-containing protein [Deltaproteobacteria bacterium]|nr:zinc ribbon domain-containing protein [Deltaproteobacteria bacterium]